MSVAENILHLVERQAPSLPTPEDARSLLRRRGILVREVAAALDVHPVTVSKWLAGTQHSTGSRAEAYATLLQILADHEVIDEALEGKS